MQLNDMTLFRQQALIDGQWRDAPTGDVIAVTNPANGEQLGSVPKMGADETREAIEAANRALPAWRALTAKERANILRRWFDLMMENQDDLARLMTLEQGKPLAEAKGEISYAASFIEWFAEEGKRIYGDTIPGHQADKRLLVIKQPIGVTAAITPWNFPAAMITRKAGPALAAGCTMVLKPASQTPFSALALAELANRAGIPEILETVKIAHLKDRMPTQLSGGQQQRVALARAIVIHPQVLLMDEPLSNLDAKLRVEMRNAIKLIQQKIGITTVYVTHDQEEALAVSDRIAIMNNGIIQQIGTPKEIYQRPNCVFVATFIGLSNILEAKVKITGAAKILDFGAYEVPMDNLIPEISAGSKVLVSVRPEEFEICLNGSDGLTAVVEHSVFLGVTTHYFMRLENGQEIEVIQNSGVEDTIPNKTTVRLLVQPAKINVFTEDGNTPLIVRRTR